MKIIKVTRNQLHEVYNKLIPQNRRMIPELMVSNLYIQIENVLLVAEDDVEFMNFPRDEEISLFAIARKSTHNELKFDFTGFKSLEEKPYHMNLDKHVFVDRHSPADNSCLECGYLQDDSIHKSECEK